MMPLNLYHPLLYKPLVATSLAVILSGGVLKAADNQPIASTTKTTISIAENANEIQTQDIVADVIFAGAGRLTLQGENNTISTITAPDGSKLILDGASNTNGVKASIANIITNGVTAEGLNVNLKGNGARIAELTLSNGGTLKSLTLGDEQGGVSSGNTLILGSGVTSIENKVLISSGQELDFVLSGTSTKFIGQINNQGTSKISFNGDQAIFDGTITTAGGSTSIEIADSKNGSILGAVTTTGGQTNIVFANGTGTKSLTLGAGSNTLSSIVLGSGSASTNNTLILSTGTTTITTSTNITNSNALTFSFQNKTTLLNNLSNTGGNATINFVNGSGVLSGTITTGDANKTKATTAINIENGASGEITSLTTNSGKSTIHFKGTKGNFSGDLFASGGNNEITFASAGTFGFSSTLTADNTSTNTFNIDKNITLSNELVINGSGTITPSTGGTFFNIAEGVKLTLEKDGYRTSITTNGNGATTLAFQGSRGSFRGILVANFSSKSGKNLITFSKDGTFSFDGVLNAQQGYNRVEINHNIVFDTNINTIGSLDESVDKGNSFLLSNGASLSLINNGAKKAIRTESGESVLSFQKTGSFSGNIITSGGIMELDFKDGLSPAGDYQINLDADFSASNGGENCIRFYDSTRNLNLRRDDNFIFKGNKGKNSILIGSSGSKVSFTDTSGNTQTLKYIGGENSITFGNSDQILDANILNTKGSLAIIFGLNDKGNNVGKGIINGDITASGGNNTFSFIYDDSTLSMGDGFSIISNSSSANTFVIDHNVSILTDLNLSGDSSQNAKNIFNISDGKTLTLTNSNNAKTINTESGITEINFIGNAGKLSGNITTNTGVATFGFQDSGSYSIAGTITSNGSGKNIFDLLNQSISIANDLQFAGSNVSEDAGNIINLGAKILTLLDSSTTTPTTKSIATTSGKTSINFKANEGKIQGSISTNGTNATTQINVSSNASGTITGSISTTSGATNVSFANDGTLTLQGANNTLTNISATTNGTLKLDGYSSTSGVQASIHNPIIGNNVILNFNGSRYDTNKKAELTLESGGNLVHSIVLENGGFNNKLILTSGSTNIQSVLDITANQGIDINLQGDSQLTLPSISNISAIGSSGGGLTFNIAGGSGKTNIVSGNISTGGIIIGEDGITAFNISSQSTGIIKGNISTQKASATNVSFDDTSTLILQGATNQLSEVSATTSGILSLDGINSTSGVSASVANAIAGNNITLNFNGKDDAKKAELTLKTGGNAIKAITLGESNSATSGNKLILLNGSTSVQTAININTSQALAFDLQNNANLTLTNHLTNSGIGKINFNGSNNILTSNIETNSNSANTTINVSNSKSGIISGTITTTNGETNIVFANQGALNLRGSTNTITNITTQGESATLTLDTTNSSVILEVTHAMSNSSLTAQLGGTTNKTATLTLNNTNGNSTIKNLALTSSSLATDNILNLQANQTSITQDTDIHSDQGLTINLNNTAKLANSITNSGNLKINFNESKGELIGSINTNNTHANTTINIADSKNGIIKGVVTNTSGTTNIVFADGSGIKSLTLQEANNSLSTITLGNGNATTNNTLILTQGATTITTDTSIASQKALALDLGNGVILTNNLSNAGGDATIVFNGSSAIFNGSITTNGVSATTTIDIADSKSGIIKGAVKNTDGATNIVFADGSDEKSLALQGANNSLSAITLGNRNESTNNTLTLFTTTTIATPTSIATNKSLKVELKDRANLTNDLSNAGGDAKIDFYGDNAIFNGSITTDGASATTTINLQGNTSSTATLIGNITTQGDGSFTLNAYAKTSTFQYQNSKNLEFSAGTHIINLQTQDSKLYWKKHNGSDYAETDISTSGSAFTQINFNANATFVTCSQTSGGSTEINIANGKSGTIEGDIITSGGITTLNLAQGEKTTTLTLNGANKTLSTSGGTSTINFKAGQGIFDGSIETSSSGTLDINIESEKSGIIQQTLSTSGGGKNNLTFKGSNSALILKGSSNTLSQITSASGNNNIISLSEGEAHDKRTENKDRRKLTIESITQDSQPLTLISQTTATKADTFLIDGSTTKIRSSQQPSTHSLGIVVANGVKLSDIGKSGKILVASVKTTSGIEFAKTSQVISGFTTATATFDTKTTDQNGTAQENGNYTSYFIKSMQNTQVIAAEQEITATAFTLNYDLYVANFNSLNKRMGELRENPYSQGIWTRVFNGALSNDFGLKTKTNYTTIQAGYDYAFGSEGANNYLGFALSYALSTSTSEHAFDDKGQKRSIDSIYSNAFEVALYNSFVSDEGWYNDTIAKFSYLMSDFKINNITNPSNTTSTNNDTQNFALTLSDEVGYKFALGESKEWGITPQLELGFGYFNQSDFKQTLENSGAFLQSNADSVLTLRARVGSSFSYDFKAFCNPKTFNASLYLGTFYEYDYVSGGEIKFRTDQITQDTANNLSHLQSDGRAILNVGTNMTIKESTRLYIDFEKSFAGKINTDYQINFGVRYSFGEGNYTPLPQPIEQKAPLKIEDTPNNNEQDKLQ